LRNIIELKRTMYSGVRLQGLLENKDTHRRKVLQ
jgi:hypothetical protein